MQAIPTGFHILCLPIGIGKVRMKTPDRAQNPPRIRPKKNNKLLTKYFGRFPSYSIRTTYKS